MIGSDLVLRLLALARSAGGHILAILTSRSVVVVSTCCAILYAGLWLVTFLQTNGLISTALPISVGDAVVLRRSGAELRPATLGPAEKAARGQALANAETGPAAAAGTIASPVTLEIQSTPPVQLWVIDSSQQGSGTNPETGLVRLQLAGSAYSGLGSNPQLVSIPNAGGSYRVLLAGLASGRFELRVRAFVDTVDNATEYAGGGEVFKDTLLATDVSVDLDDSGTPRLDVGKVQVVMAGQVPPPSPAASPLPSEALPLPSDVAPRLAGVDSAAAAASGQSTVAGLTVYRPRPAANLPLPLPVPQLDPAPAVPHQD